MVKKTAKHGGKRVGAGRPPKHGEPTKMVAAKLPESAIARLDAYAKMRGLNRSEALLAAVERLPLPVTRATG